MPASKLFRARGQHSPAPAVGSGKCNPSLQIGDCCSHLIVGRISDPPAIDLNGAQAAKTAKSKEPKVPRKDSKQAQLIAMLRRAKGATINEVVEALEWQPHTVRGAIAGVIKKKLGLDVTSEKDDSRGRTYRIANAG